MDPATIWLDEPTRERLKEELFASCRALDQATSLWEEGKYIPAMEQVILHLQHKNFVEGVLIAQNFKLVQDNNGYAEVLRYVLTHRKPPTSRGTDES